MLRDRRHRPITIMLAAVPLLTAGWLGLGPLLARTVGPRPAVAQTTMPRYEVSVPKSWGKLVGFSSNNLLLEAPDGTLRIVDVEGRGPEYPKVKVLVRWQ